MPIVDLEMGGEVVRVPSDRFDECMQLAKAISELGPAIQRASQPILDKVPKLEKEVGQRKNTAIGVKITTLLCAAVLISGYFPEAARMLGFAIVVLSILDYGFGNHRNLIGTLDELAGHRAVIDFLRGMDGKRIEVLRYVRTRPVETLDAYYLYLTGLLEELNKGGVELRKRMERREAELAQRLAPPEPKSALLAEGASTGDRSKD
jgi:hypothetical protein